MKVDKKKKKHSENCNQSFTYFSRDPWLYFNQWLFLHESLCGQPPPFKTNKSLLFALVKLVFLKFPTVYSMSPLQCIKVQSFLNNKGVPHIYTGNLDIVIQTSKQCIKGATDMAFLYFTLTDSVPWSSGTLGPYWPTIIYYDITIDFYQRFDYVIYGNA